jgi:hypothetical protein
MAQLLVLLGVVTVGILPVHPASPGRYGLQLKSRWMRGCWEGTQGKRHLAENWGRTGVKMLPATSQTAVDGKTLPCTAHAGGTFQTSADWWDRRPKAICVTGGSQQQRRCGQCGKCFPEGDPPNPDDDLWEGVGWSVWLPRRSFQGTKRRSSVVQGASSTPSRTGDRIAPGIRPPCRAEHLREDLDLVPNREPQ